MNDAPERDLRTLSVPRWGRLVETGDRYEPYRLLDRDGVTVEAVAVLRSYLFCAVCDHRMYGKNSKNRSYYACQPKKDQHYDADWYTAHPKAIWISERVMLEAIHTFFEDRIFGPQRHQLLQATMTATPTADATNKAAEDIQRRQNEVDSLARRKDLLLDQLAAPEADDTAPDITAEFRRGIGKRFDVLEHQRRTALTQLQTHAQKQQRTVPATRASSQ